MTPAALLHRLEAEGVGVSLNLKLEADEKPSDETLNLIRENRDALLEHLARERCPVPAAQGGVTLQGDLLLNLMGWTAQHQELRLERPGAVVLNARPEHIRDAVEAHPWGLVYDPERYLLVSWGDVPTSALRGKHDLQTGEPFIRDSEALYLLRQRNVSA